MITLLLINFNTLSCQTYFFPDCMGGVLKTCGNSRGVGYFCVKKMEFPERSVGDLHEIPSVVGVWIFSGTTH